MLEKQRGDQHGWNSMNEEKALGDEVREFRSSKTLWAIVRTLTLCKMAGHWRVLKKVYSECCEENRLAARGMGARVEGRTLVRKLLQSSR